MRYGRMVLTDIQYDYRLGIRMKRHLSGLVTIFIFIIALALPIQPAWGVDCGALPPPNPVTIDSIATFTFSGFGGSDCWGWEAPDGTEYAIMGVADGIAFVNATAKQVIGTVPGPTSGCGSVRWRDIKTYQHYCYAVSECTGTNQGLMIIDMQYLPDSVHFVKSFTDGFLSTSHNLSIDTDAGYLYLLYGSATGFRVFSLADPENPVEFTGVATGDIHDVYARRDTLWVAEGNRGTWSMWDMADKNNAQLIVRVPVPNAGYVHNIWPTDDAHYVVTTEETAFKTSKVWDIQDPQNVQLVAEYLAPSQLAHNAQVIGDYVVSSHYESGIVITDLTTPECPAQVAQFDTWSSSETPNFNGCWGAFPYTSSGNIYASNEDGRLFILNADLSLTEFSGTPRVGEAPLAVDFMDTSPKQSLSWHWDFGDGDTSTLSAPTHTYTAGGLYGVQLDVTSADGSDAKLKKYYVTVLADTMEVKDTSVAVNVSGYWEIRGHNAVPLTEFTLPVSITNVTSVIFFDSLSSVGTRTEYFESKQVVFDSRFTGKLAVHFVADVGGGAPPLPPGDGPIARVYFRTRINASPGDTAAMTVGPLGSYSFTAATATTNFVPVFNGATLTIADFPCDCASHGDLDDDGFYTALDLGKLIDHLFAGSSAPPTDATCPHNDRGDYNCDGFDDALDLGYLIDLLFAGGPSPCDPCACSSYPDSCP